MYDRMLVLMKQNLQGRDALLELCRSLRTTASEEKKREGRADPVIAGAWDDINTLAEFFLTIDSTEPTDDKGAAGVLDVLQNAKHGVLALCKTAVPQCPYWQATETKYRKLQLHVATTLPKLAAASKTLVDLQECTSSVLSEKLGAILKEVPLWVDELGKHGAERIKKVVDEVKERLKVGEREGACQPGASGGCFVDEASAACI